MGRGTGRNGSDRRARLRGERRQGRQVADPPRRRRRRPRGPGGPIDGLAALIRRLFGLVWRIAWRAGLVAGVVLVGIVGYYALTMPSVSAVVDGRARGSVTMLDRAGEVFAWRGEQFGGQITAQTVAPVLRDAVVATEDRRFYGHPGVDPIGIASAIRINLREGRGPLSGHGGSTITQQTAKLLCLGNPYDPNSGMTEAEYEADCRETTLERKAREALYALALELRYSKDEILSIYLNRAYLGAGARGFEAASQRYFGKSANQVTPAEAAMLAGLLVAPTRYAPTSNLERSQNRADVIVGLMAQQGRITAEQAAEARRNPAVLSEAAERRAGGYFADWVMEQGPSYLTTDTTEDVIVETTFDQSIQDAAEDALVHVFETKVAPSSEAQAAIVVMSADGAVRAMVGGRKLTGVAGQFNRAIQAKRQTGSAFKPFVYAAALDLGYSPSDVIVDEPLTMEIPGSGTWSPENYGGGYQGPVTLTQSLAQSINTTAVRLSETVGRESVRNIASEFGIDSDLADGPALALGASESTLMEMTGAYAGILNGGSAVEPYGLTELRLKGEEASLIDKSGGIRERVVRPEAARQLVFMMHEVVESGTGTRANLGERPAAGKTGTTQAARDAWFLGFTADYVAGVWMGYDDNTPLTGVTGGGLPAEIWRETMLRVHDGLPVAPLPMNAPDPATQYVQDTPESGRSAGRDGGAEGVIRDVLDSIFGR